MVVRTVPSVSRIPLPTVLVTLAACSDLSYSSEVTNRRPFEPPPVYTEWWAATEVCSGRGGPFERIDWFLADGIVGDGVLARARWSPPHEIVIVSGWEDDAKVVRHEMLHDLLDGDAAHRAAAWDACELRFEAG